MFRRKQSPADTQLQRKVVPFVAVEMSFSLEKRTSVCGSFSREKRVSPRRAQRLSLLPHSPRRTQVRLKPLLSLVYPGSTRRSPDWRKTGIEVKLAEASISSRD